MYMMMNRSGGGTVREIIAEIVSRCEQQEQEQVAPAKEQYKHQTLSAVFWRNGRAIPTTAW